MLIKNVECDTVFVAVETVVPDKKYYSANKNTRQIDIARSDFSGVIYWHTLEGKLAHVEEFRNGKTLRSASFIGLPAAEYHDLANRVRKATGICGFYVGTANTTRDVDDEFGVGGYYFV